MSILELLSWTLIKLIAGSSLRSTWSNPFASEAIINRFFIKSVVLFLPELNGRHTTMTICYRKGDADNRWNYYKVSKSGKIRQLQNGLTATAQRACFSCTQIFVNVAKVNTKIVLNQQIIVYKIEATVMFAILKLETKLRNRTLQWSVMRCLIDLCIDFSFKLFPTVYFIII